MRTLLITLEYHPFKGGIANYYTNLVKYWPLTEKISVLDNFHRKLLSEADRFSWLRSVSVLLKQLKKPGFDYLLVGQILPLGTAAYFASLIKPFNYGVILHGLDFTSAIKSKRKQFLTGLILKRAHKIICANSKVAEIVKIFDSSLMDKIAIVNPGIEPIIAKPDIDKIENLRATYQLNGYFTLFTLGRLVLRKGVDSVIKALNDMRGEDIKIKYFIAGLGREEKHLRSLAASSSYKESIVFLGELSEHEKWLWLHACDAFIMPAREIGEDFEGFGIVYLEANLAGKPVIAGNSGGVKDAVEDGVNGFLVDPNNIAEIKDKVMMLKNNYQLSFDLGVKGRERAITNFNWEKQAGYLCQIIKK